MKALIDPRVNRVCEVRATEFPVADPLKWVDVPADKTVSPDKWEYAADTFTEKSVPKASLKRLAIDDLAALLVSKLLVAQAEIDALKK